MPLFITFLNQLQIWNEFLNNNRFIKRSYSLQNMHMYVQYKTASIDIWMHVCNYVCMYLYKISDTKQSHIKLLFLQLLNEWNIAVNT